MDEVLDTSLRIRTKIFDIIHANPDDTGMKKIGLTEEDFSDNLYQQTWTIKQKVKNISDGTKTKLEFSDNMKGFSSFQNFVDIMKQILMNYQNEFPKLFTYNPDEKSF